MNERAALAALVLGLIVMAGLAAFVREDEGGGAADIDREVASGSADPGGPVVPSGLFGPPTVTGPSGPADGGRPSAGGGSGAGGGAAAGGAQRPAQPAGGATPEAAPQATPKPTPKPKPEAAPQATPKPTPKPTPADPPPGAAASNPTPPPTDREPTDPRAGDEESAASKAARERAEQRLLERLERERLARERAEREALEAAEAEADGASRSDKPVAALLALRNGPNALPGYVIASRILQLGPGHMPEVVALLTGADAEGVEPEPQGFPGAADAAGPEEGRIGDSTEAILLEVLRQWPRDEVVRALSRGLRGDEDVYQRLDRARFLGELGTGTLEGILEVLDGVPSIQLRRTYVSSRVVEAIRGALADDEFAHVALASALDHAQPSLAACAARALAQSGRTREIELMVSLLGQDAYLDEVVLNELAGLPELIVTEAIDQARQTVRDLLADPQPRIRKAAAVVLGRLEDTESLEALADLLEDSDATVVAGAHRALQDLSGLTWPEEAPRWRAWIASERQWLEHEAPLLKAVMTDGDVSDAVRAARELSGHTLFRRDVALCLEPGLTHGEPAVQASTCRALERLGTLIAAPRLVQLLESESLEVRRAAHRALVTLSGEDLERDPAAWRAWLEG